MSQSVIQDIGILGGGQLGLMLSESLSKLGARVHILDPDRSCPAARLTPYVSHASFLDEAALSALFSRCDRVTYEFEHIPTQALRNIIKKDEHRNKLWPSLDILETAQNRIVEKIMLRSAGAPLANWEPVRSLSELSECRSKWLGLEKKAILKTANGGYDGKGQWILKCENDWKKLFESASKLDPFPECVLEEMLTLQTELSVIVARHPENGTVTLPAVENIHANGILETTLYPPRVSKELTAEAEQIALSIAQALDIYGMLCVEFFLVKHNEQPLLLVNEIAPRPHNSGHITRCSLTRSQFDLLAQTLMDMPISTEPISEHIQWAMWNTLGDLWRLTSRPDYTFWPKSLLSDTHVCEAMLYGKTEARTGRKMGHVILKHDSPECLFQTIDALKNTFNLESRNQNQ